MPPAEQTLLRYTVFGLRIASQLPLPELHAFGGEAAADVTIVQADLSHLPPSSPFELGRHGDGYVIDVPDVARFALDGNGCGIEVDAKAGLSPRNVRLYLLGSAIGAVLHVRGLLPLHANAVVVEGRAYAFMGHPGAGKSTLAAAFHDRGFTVLSDDVCVVTAGANGAPMAQPGIPRLKLWLDAVQRSGRQAEALDRAYDDWDKFTVPVGEAPAAPAPLAGIYLLARGDADVPRFRQLRGAEAAAALIGNTYRGGYLDTVGGRPRHLAACLALVGTVPVFELARPWDAAALDGQVDRIVEQLRAA